MKLLAVDGNSIINRAFYGVRPLSAGDGTPTNAVFGFLNIFSKLLKAHKPDAVAVAFDLSRHTFRTDEYAEYKANRKGMPEDLAKQLPIVKELLCDMGYSIVTCENYEGDDILGTLSDACCKNGDECIIASGDRDCLQLATDCVSIDLQKTGDSILYTPQKVKEDYGITPSQVIELKALMGDSSDNIPGVKGIGEKSALTLLEQGETIDKLYENIESLAVTPRIKKLLEEHRDEAFLSRRLATICKEAPIDTDISKYVKGETNAPALAARLKQLELYSFFERLGVNVSDAADEQQKQSNKITLEVKQALPEMEKGSSCAMVITGESIFVNCGGYIYIVSPNQYGELFAMLCEKEAKVCTFGAKQQYKILAKTEPSFCFAFDAELAAYLLNPNAKEYSIDELSQRYLPPGTEADLPPELADIALLLMLCEKLKAEIEQNGLDYVLYDIEMPLCKLLAEMENEGFAVDKKGIELFGERLARDIDITVEQIYRLSGEEFNINSTKELGRILFEKLGLPAKKKTKTGYSTNAEVLESLAQSHPIIQNILEYRKLSKLLSTYVTGLLKVIDTDGRVHSTFIQTETRTGRISSAEPNVQNIPVRTELGSEMRKFFVAKEGYVLVDADYSQIELRILAAIADDKSMIEAFASGRDIHTATAAQVFGYTESDLPHELRSRAKAINFGIVYGIGAHTLSQNIGVSYAEAKDYISAYLKTYSGVAAYMERVVREAHQNGFVKTLYGRKRDLAEINSSNKMTSAFAERVAMNTPIQGTAADIIKLAMVKVANRLKKENLPAKLILQVHDELIIEAREDIKDKAAAILKEEMEQVASLAVKLTAEVNTGKTWYDAK